MLVNTMVYLNFTYLTFINFIIAEELVKKRMHELRHAQEIRQIYEEKIKRVNKMEKNLFSFLEDIRMREEVMFYIKI